MTKTLTDKSRPEAPEQDDDVFYPESDGEPMGETGIHVRCILDLMAALDMLFIMMKRKDVHVAGDMFLYYEKGNPKANKSPDVMVTFGVDGTDPRRTFKTWVEGTAPHVIFEITSDSTWKIDVYEKPILYASLGVEEYYIFDPIDECLNPRFQGFELVDGAYRPLPIKADGSILSKRLSANLRPEGYRIRILQMESGESVPVPVEWLSKYEEINHKYKQADADRSRAIERVQEEAKRAEEVAKRAQEEHARAEEEARRAEEEAKRAREEHTRAEEEARRAQEEHARAEEEAKRAQEEHARAEEEARRSKALEAEVARLRSLLENQANPDA